MTMPRVPRRIDNPPSSALSPLEQHLLESIDGALDESELAFVVGASVAQVEKLVTGLVTSGFVEVTGKALSGDSTSHEAADGGDLQISVRARQRIDAVLATLGERTHYELLGVADDATADELRDAYFRVAPTFHPDRYFRKRLGPYKAKIEAVFTAVTKAYDVVRIAARRQRYDAALRRSGVSRAGGGQQSAVPLSAPQLATMLPASARDTASNRVASTTAPIAQAPSSTRVAVPQARAAIPTATPAPLLSEAALRQARRDQLARQLLRSSPGLPATTASPSPTRQESSGAVPPPASPPRASPPLASPPRASPPLASPPLASPQIVPPARATPLRAARSQQAVPSPATSSQQAIPSPPSLSAAASAPGDLRERRLQRYLAAAEQALRMEDFRAAEAAFEQAARVAPERPEFADRARDAARRSGGT
ncbi:MAG: hypothetical protein EXR75_14935 [Myxococcales bacterium]|nr:hypothetical protein [Myxococcales bacterium]